MKFFVDNNLSEQLAQGMKAFGEDVMHLKERFAEDVEDVKWLEHIGRDGIFLITRDERVRFSPSEKGSLLRFEVGAFFLGGKNRTRCELIQQLVRNWPRIKDFARRTPTPFAWRIPPSGSNFKRIPLT